MSAEQVPSPQQSRYSIRAVERVCDLFDLLQRSPDGVTLPQAVEATQLPKSSVFRYLATLVSRRYARRDPVTGAYGPGLALLAYELDALRASAQPLVAALAEDLQETVHLTVLEAGRAFHLVSAESPRSVRVVVRRGDSLPLHDIAAGWVILAQMGRDDARSLLTERGAAAATVLEELDEVAARGWAFQAGEGDPDASAVAVPLPLRRAAALGVVAPSSRLDAARAGQIAGRLAAGAEQLVVAAGESGAVGV